MKTAGTFALASIVGLCALARPSAGQHLQWGQTGWPRLGRGLALVADRDGDGQPDLVTSVRVPDNSTEGRPEVWFLSSRDGTFLPQFMSPPPGDSYLSVWQSGDFNGDGFRDFLLTGTLQGQNGLHAINGVTLTRLFRLPPVPGVSFYGIASDLDVNGDGRPDVLLTAPGQVAVYAYNHLGNLLYITHSQTPGVVWGPAINKFADFDGDGCDDFVVGIGEPTTAGGAEVVSGRTGLSLVRVVGPTPGDYLGVGVAGCGDMDGDGRPDIAAGGGALGSPGSVQVFSSATGLRLRSWYSGYYHDGFGYFMLGTVDVDQDGVDDLIATNPGEPVHPSTPNVLSTMSVLSGRDGTTLMRFADPSGPSSMAGFSIVIPLPPRTGSTLPRFSVPGVSWGYDPTTVPFYRGKIWMFEGGPAGASTISTPCTGTLLSEPRIGLRSLTANSMRVTLSGAEPGMLALLVLGLGLQPSPFALSPFGFPGCSLHPQVLEIGVAVPGTVGLGAGYSFHDFQRGSAAGPLPMGLTVYGQWVALGSGPQWPGGVSATFRWYLQ